MALEIGNFNQLSVLRKTDIAYVLKDSSGEEVFLHVNESNHQELRPNQIVDAFIYIDAKGRVAATLSQSLITNDKNAFLEVLSIKDDLGVFLDMGISKDLLLSKDYLGNNQELWPRVGEKIYVELKVKDKMSARLVPYHELKSTTENLKVNDEVTGIVQVISKIGLFILTYDHNLILVKRANLRGKYHYGQEVVVKITYLTKNGYEGSLTKFKEELRVDDSKLILDYLKKHHNQMPYTADSSSEEIQKAFNLSRKAFKRALGLLYKQRKIDFIDDKTILLEDK